MTYSQEVKNELCSAHISCKSCKKAMLYGMLMCCRGIRENSITLNLENKIIVDFFTQTLIDMTGAIITVESPDFRQYSNSRGKQSRPIFTIRIEDENDINKIIEVFFGDISKKHYLNKALIQKKCCETAFLKGVFLICGSIINPQKEYHFEFSLSSDRVADQIQEQLLKHGFDFKKTQRANSFILYIKESNKIEEILTFLGAVKATFELMNLKIEKEMRNNINRVTNCETANIGKTINASVNQIEQIRKIRENAGFETLSIELQEIALLRLMNPDSSLNELCILYGNKISRSGLNHRLKKLLKIAEELEE